MCNYSFTKPFNEMASDKHETAGYSRGPAVMDGGFFPLFFAIMHVLCHIVYRKPVNAAAFAVVSG